MAKSYAARAQSYEWAIDSDLNTYACKDDLKAIGCLFDPDRGWVAKDEATYLRGVGIARKAGPKPVRASKPAKPQRAPVGEWYADLHGEGAALRRYGSRYGR